MYFPLFINVDNKNVLIVGGGHVAYRKACSFIEFNAQVTVVSMHVIDEMKDLDLIVYMDEYKDTYLDGMELVIAATDDTKLNHRIAADCRKRHILVNAVDQVEDCDFIFPSILKEKELVAAFSSGGNSPVLTQYIRDKNKEIITESLGDINAYMGSIRNEIQGCIPSHKRKEIYQKILHLCIDKDRPLHKEELEEVLHNG